jgi:Raf kinase inhibitor-like YbhB/YbcL family protein
MTRYAVLLASVFLSSIALGADFKISSSDVGPSKPPAQTFVFNGFGCVGSNESPAVSWSGAPAGTQSFALSIYDPDAPTGSGWWHWYVINLPATTTSLPRGAGKADGSQLPKGAQQINTDFGAPGYGGPCPPAGDKPHRYIVTVYALKVAKLDVPATATAALAGFNVKGNALGETSFTFKFGR